MKRLLHYALAVAATAAAVALRLRLEPLVGSQLPFITLFGAVAFAVWVGGRGPGLVAAILGYAAVERLILSGARPATLALDGPAGVAALLSYLFTCLVIIGLGSGLREARRRSEAAARDLRRQQTRLEAEMAELQRTGAALRRSEAELETLADRTPIYLTRCSADRRFVFVNRAAAAVLGLPAHEIVGRTIAEVMGDEAFAVMAPHIDGVLRGEQVEFEAEVPYAHSAPRFVHAIDTPDRDDAGNVVGWFTSVRDVSERRAAAAVLQERERLFRTLVAASSQVTWQYRPGGAPIRQISDEATAWWRAFTGQSEAERTARDGTGWLDAVHPDDRSLAWRNWKEIRAVRGPTEAAYRVRRAGDGGLALAPGQGRAGGRTGRRHRGDRRHPHRHHRSEGSGAGPQRE